jgi:EAL domain-containing protein (putative c-di-GMP-specific phosphodiesterase class I)
MSTTETQTGTSPRGELDFAGALERGEIAVHFQPKVDLRSGRVIGVEALARWEHPAKGVLAASEFMDALDSPEEMIALTERVVEISTRAAGDWWRSGLRLQLGVNLPAVAVSSTEWELDGLVARSLAAAGLPGEAIQFDVTEDSLLLDPGHAGDRLARLAAGGGGISLDDFGTGHFSLRQLITLPVDELKIDRSLIMSLDETESRTIVRAIIHLAHQVGLPVVAEGVETKETWQQLRSMGCERAQGFLISPPIPSREVPAWLASWNQRARELSSTRRIRRRSRRSGKVTPAVEATA